MTSVKEFRNSGYRNQLHEFLISPCGVALLSLLEKKPSSLPEINGIHHSDTVVARMFAFMSGNNSCIANLKELSEPWVDGSEIAKASMRPEWSDHLPPEMRAAFANQFKNPNQA